MKWLFLFCLSFGKLEKSFLLISILNLCVKDISCVNHFRVLCGIVEVLFLFVPRTSKVNSESFNLEKREFLFSVLVVG